MPLPRSKYSEPRHTPGKQYTLDGKEYRGWYVETFEKRYYTGKIIDVTSKEIFPIQEQTKQENIFIQQQITISQPERDTGILKRYIIQKINNRKIVEITKERYDLLIVKSGYRGVIIDWVVKGPAKDIFFNGYPFFGAERRNKETVSKLESTIPGISNFFKNYSEFVE
jgi:hypothetical protein